MANKSYIVDISKHEKFNSTARMAHHCDNPECDVEIPNRYDSKSKHVTIDSPNEKPAEADAEMYWPSRISKTYCSHACAMAALKKK